MHEEPKAWDDWTMLAAGLLGVEPERVTPGSRERAKAAYLATSYGASPRRIAESVLRGKDSSTMELPTWTTKDGEVWLVAGMTDQHLKNAIKYFSEPMAEMTKRIEEEPRPKSKRARALYGERDERVPEPERYKKALAHYMHRLAPLVMEAAIRGLDQESLDAIRSAVGRSARDEEAPKPTNSDGSEPPRLMNIARGRRGGRYRRIARYETGDVFKVGRRCVVRVTRQVWVNDCAVDTDDREDIDITDALLRLGAEKSLQIENDSDEADELVVQSGFDPLNQPFYVDCEEAIREFWEAAEGSGKNERGYL